MIKKNIFIKTFLYLALGMFLFVVFVHLIIFFIYNDFYIKDKEAKLVYHINILSEVIKDLPSDRVDSILNNYAKNNNINISLKTLTDIKYYQGNSFFIECFFENDSDIKLGNVDVADMIKIKTKKVVIHNTGDSYLQVVANLKSLEESKKIVWSILPYSMFLSLLFAFLFSYLYSKTLTNPIKKITSIVNKMTKLEKNLKIDIPNNDEIGQLADDINILYSQLLEAIENYKIKMKYILNLEKERLIFFRANSHELKTPLAKISILIENMQNNIGKYKNHNKYLKEVLIIINELSEMINKILVTVKTGKFNDKIISDISIREQLIQTIKEYNIIVKSKKINVETNISGDFTIIIAKEDLEKILSNVISNAVKYVSTNGTIKIILSDKQLEVYNDSISTPTDKIHNMLESSSFLSVTEKHSTGMGLYIIKSTLENYSIEYEFQICKNGYKFLIYKEPVINSNAN